MTAALIMRFALLSLVGFGAGSASRGMTEETDLSSPRGNYRGGEPVGRTMLWPDRTRRVFASPQAINTHNYVPPLGGPLPPTPLLDEIDNGVIRIRFNDYAPIITGMWVQGVLAVPHDNIGADFQISTRSTKGNGYNPTQGGDCSGTASSLTGVFEHWNALAPDVPAAFGVRLEMDPRNYNEPEYPGCMGPGEILPYDMAFAVTLGDGRSMPRQLMVLDMSIRKEVGSAAEDLVKGLSELPVIYLDNRSFRYAYYSIEQAVAGDQEYEPFRVLTTSGVSHDTRLWPYFANYPVAQPARVIMLCDHPDVVDNPAKGLCVALYSHEGATMQVSHRQGAVYDLTSIAAINHDPADPLITDYLEHTQRRLVAVGNADTISACIAWAEANLSPGGWRRW